MPAHITEKDDTTTSNLPTPTKPSACHLVQGGSSIRLQQDDQERLVRCIQRDQTALARAAARRAMHWPPGTRGKPGHAGNIASARLSVHKYTLCCKRCGSATAAAARTAAAGSSSSSSEDDYDKAHGGSLKWRACGTDGVCDERRVCGPPMGHACDIGGRQREAARFRRLDPSHPALQVGLGDAAAVPGHLHPCAGPRSADRVCIAAANSGGGGAIELHGAHGGAGNSWRRSGGSGTALRGS